MNQAEVGKVVSKLKHAVKTRRRLSNVDAAVGRHQMIKKIVTALFKHERIELVYTKGDEARGYAERLISDAIRYGDRHKETMEMANYWLIEKQLIHKLFKVLVPRYQNSTTSYTKMWRAPSVQEYSAKDKRPYDDLWRTSEVAFKHRELCVLELKGNIYPPLAPNYDNANLIHNVLLTTARKAFRNQKYSVSKDEVKNLNDEKSSADSETQLQESQGTSETQLQESQGTSETQLQESQETSESISESTPKSSSESLNVKLDSNTPTDSVDSKRENETVCEVEEGIKNLKMNENKPEISDPKK